MNVSMLTFKLMFILHFSLFAGFVPRTLWITIGGAVFFGAYQAAVDFCSQFDVLR
jgi:hypothetical protein